MNFKTSKYKVFFRNALKFIVKHVKSTNNLLRFKFKTMSNLGYVRLVHWSLVGYKFNGSLFKYIYLCNKVILNRIRPCTIDL